MEFRFRCWCAGVSARVLSEWAKLSPAQVSFFFLDFFPFDGTVIV